MSLAVIDVQETCTLGRLAFEWLYRRVNLLHGSSAVQQQRLQAGAVGGLNFRPESHV